MEMLPPTLSGLEGWLEATIGEYRDSRPFRDFMRLAFPHPTDGYVCDLPNGFSSVPLDTIWLHSQLSPGFVDEGKLSDKVVKVLPDLIERSWCVEEARAKEITEWFKRKDLRRPVDDNEGAAPTFLDRYGPPPFKDKIHPRHKKQVYLRFFRHFRQVRSNDDTFWGHEAKRLYFSNHFEDGPRHPLKPNSLLCATLTFKDFGIPEFFWWILLKENSPFSLELLQRKSGDIDYGIPLSTERASRGLPSWDRRNPTSTTRYVQEDFENRLQDVESSSLNCSDILIKSCLRPHPLYHFDKNGRLMLEGLVKHLRSQLQKRIEPLRKRLNELNSIESGTAPKRFEVNGKVVTTRYSELRGPYRVERDKEEEIKKTRELSIMEDVSKLIITRDNEEALRSMIEFNPGRARKKLLQWISENPLTSKMDMRFEDFYHGPDPDQEIMLLAEHRKEILELMLPISRSVMVNDQLNRYLLQRSNVFWSHLADEYKSSDGKIALFAPQSHLWYLTPTAFGESGEFLAWANSYWFWFFCQTFGRDSSFSEAGPTTEQLRIIRRLAGLDFPV